MDSNSLKKRMSRSYGDLVRNPSASHRLDYSPAQKHSPLLGSNNKSVVPRNASSMSNVTEDFGRLTAFSDYAQKSSSVSHHHDRTPSIQRYSTPAELQLHPKSTNAQAPQDHQLLKSPNGELASLDFSRDRNGTTDLFKKSPSGMSISQISDTPSSSALPDLLCEANSMPLKIQNVYLYKISSQRAPVLGMDTKPTISKKMERFVNQHALERMFPSSAPFTLVDRGLYFSLQSSRPKAVSKTFRRVNAQKLTPATPPDQRWTLIEADTSILAGPKEIDFEVTVEEQKGNHVLEVGRIRSFFPKDSKNASLSTDDKSRGALDAFIASELRKKLESSGIVNTFTHGHRVFSKLHAKTIPNISVKYPGLEGKIVYNDQGSEPTLCWKPCIATFFPEVLVSDFLVAIGGPSLYVSTPNDPMVDQIKTVLKGTRIAAAVASKSEKRIFTVTGFDSSVRGDPDNPRDNPDNLGALHRISKKFSLDSMRYPDMVCLHGRYGNKVSDSISLPAEYCKILPDQPFRHEPPLQAGDISIVEKKSRRSDNFVPKQGNPYNAIAGEDFQLFFAQVIDHTSPVSNDIADVTSKAWGAFKHELGQRFDGKLAFAVATSLTGGRSTILGQLLERHSDEHFQFEDELSGLLHYADVEYGIRKVLLIAVPPSLPKKEVDNMKAWCDVHLGAQCCFISTRELLSRSNRHINESSGEQVSSSDPSISRQLVKYTGAIARLMFSRAMFPADPAPAKRNSPTNPDLPRNRLLVGLQITDLASCSDVLDPPVGPVKHDQFYLLTVVTFDDTRQVDTVVTTSIASVENMGGTLANAISAVRSLSQRDETAIHVVGHDAFKLDFFERFLIGLDDERTTEQQADGPLASIGRIQVVAYSPESKVTSASARVAQPTLTPSVTLIDRPEEAMPKDGGTEMSYHSTELSERLTEVMDMNEELEEVFKRPGGNSQPLKEDAWRVSYHRSMEPEDASEFFRHDFPAGGRAHIQHRQLERRALPPILFLTQKATKRAFTRFKKNEEFDPHSENSMVCPIEVPPVDQDLAGSLYYL